MNPLSEEAMTAVHATDVLTGHDQYGMAWISAFRAREASVT